MKRILIITATLAALGAPLTGVASAKVSKADKREAQKECRDLRGTTDASREAFKAQFRNFGACVSERAREAKAERKQAKRNAAKECKAERAEDAAAFSAKYRNLGKCVSERAKAKREEQDEEDAAAAEEQTNAAQECAAERTADRKAFEEKYGSNHNKKNAFGKCVSQKVHEPAEGEDGGS
jgi:hypothetical protein